MSVCPRARVNSGLESAQGNSVADPVDKYIPLVHTYTYETDEGRMPMRTTLNIEGTLVEKARGNWLRGSRAATMRNGPLTGHVQGGRIRV
jgi:hypothetical protein